MRNVVNCSGQAGAGQSRERTDEIRFQSAVAAMNLLERSGAGASPETSPGRVIKVDERHVLIAKLAAAALVDGNVPPAAMPHLLEVARQKGLSAYDVHLIVKHVRLHGE